MNPITREQLLEKLRLRISNRLAEETRKGRNVVRPDAAAWVLMALGRAQGETELVLRLSDQLQAAQLSDGRVPVDRRFPDAAWPTPLAVLAWLQTGKSPANLDRAVQFLLHWQGDHSIKEPAATLGHDTSIPGWPWISGAHSWIEPTSVALIAVCKARSKEEPRCLQARKMILNRQLPRGGWNYGNTTVFGKELRPMPHSTGMALTALKDAVEEGEVQRSIEYLESSITTIRAPVSLGWGLIGLQAWGRPVPQAASWVSDCLNSESELIEYNLSMLGLLYCALLPQPEDPLLG